MKTTGVPTLLGIPFDGYSSYLRGAGDAPAKVRTTLRCDASNSWSELGVDLGVAGVYEDAGDLTFEEKDAFAAIEAGVGALLDQGKRPVSLGGDHSITYPIVKAVAQRHPGLTMYGSDPIYLQSYVVADMVARQIQHTIDKKFGTQWGKTAGDYLRDHFYSRGASGNLSQIMQAGTGERLTATHLIEQLRGTGEGASSAQNSKH